MDMERTRTEPEEKLKRWERQHPFNMMQMIMGALYQKQSYPSTDLLFATWSQMLVGQVTLQMSSPNNSFHEPNETRVLSLFSQ
jgi:hypothetical protein